VEKLHPNIKSTSSAAMLQMQKDQKLGLEQSEIRIPTELLTNLLARVNRLETELKSVKHELSTLQQNCGGAFILFPKLPPELRRLVQCLAACHKSSLLRHAHYPWSRGLSDNLNIPDEFGSFHFVHLRSM
jgi:hypothetical protein